ncbi:MAG: polysaccharide biosynthesis protein [Candidatus Dormibacteraceae bacterium]
MRRLLALLRAERVLSHSLIVGLATLAVGLLGVAFQSVVSHRLRPANYGEVFAVLTLITFIALPSNAFTLLMSRATSRDRAGDAHLRSAALLHGGSRALLLIGIVCAASFALASPLISHFFALPLPLLLAAAAGIPFALALPLLLGEFQGQQRFVSFSLLAASQAALRLLGALALGFFYGPVGVVAGVSIGSALVFAVAWWMLRRKLSVKPAVPWLRPAAAYLALILPSTLALGFLLSTDVLVVKHFFSSRQAGEYAAVAAMGRGIFWGAMGVSGVLFSKVVFRETQGRSGLPLITAALALVAVGGLGGLALLSAGSTWLLTAFSGSAYAEAAPYVPWYAIGMTLLGASAVLIATQQSRGKPAFLAVLLPFTLLEPALLTMFHENLMQVVQVLDIAMGLLLAGLAIQFVLQQRVVRPAGEHPKATVAATPPAAPRVKVGR